MSGRSAAVSTLDGNNLCLAAMEAGTARLSTLLAKGVPVDFEDKYGHTALMRASEYGRESSVLLLLQSGALINYQSSVDGFTALMIAAAYGLNDKVSIVSLLLSRGADPSLRNKDGATALEKAKQFSSTEVVKMIEKHISTTDMSKHVTEVSYIQCLFL